jgi:acetoin utilization deacetylase AcuC-like enzyme
VLTIFSPDHRLHHGKAELIDGRLQPCHERPERADLVLGAVEKAGLGDIVAPEAFGRAPLERVHSPPYLDFLASAWDLWAAEGREGDALPLSWAVRGMRQVEPEHIDGRLSYFSFDAGTPVTAGTWRAASAAADVALTGAGRLLGGADRVFSLCRPPGHHAAVDYYGGYCFLNNAAIAAQYLVDGGAGKVAILDIDYHHGNGTQSIFYDRDDVLFVSIHGDPRQEYPFFLGHADERGNGRGLGFTANFPLRWQTGAGQWFEALDAGLALVREFAPDFIVVSLGLDTFVDDPISQFRLQTSDYLVVGARIADLGMPVLFVLEGGYAVAELGNNAVNVLAGASKRTT